MENQNLEDTQRRVKEEPPVEFVLILPRPTLGWPALKQEKDVKPKLIPTVKMAKIDAEWKSKPKLFQTFFTCQHCQLVVNSQWNLTQHLRACSKVIPARFGCDFCGKRFLRKYRLREHMPSHSSGRRFRCTKCGYGFKSKPGLLHHMRMKTIYECAVCGIEFSCKLLLDRHGSDLHGNVYKCVKCSFQTGSKGIFMGHKGTHDKPFACSTCQKKFRTNHSLMPHQKQHRHGIYATAPEETFDCNKCNKSFSSQAYLSQHQKRVHDVNEVKCEVCDKVFRNQIVLLQHSQFHNKVECSVCHKKINKYLMATHLRSHSAANHFKCDLCDLSTKTKGSLKRHIEARHLLTKFLNDSKHREDFSEFELLKKLQLKFRSSLTTSEKNFKCDQCTKAFVTPRKLNYHKREVHVDKLVECDICKRAFKTKNVLNRHKAGVHSKK